MLYPIKFETLYKDYVWGGRNFPLIGKEIPKEGKVAESWELSCHKNGTSVISNGEFSGTKLTDLIKKFPRQIVGTQLDEKDIEKFPLLIKFIDANDRLSVQVHPTDEYAKVNENGELGKNEMWYVIHAKPGATLVAGVKDGMTKDVFKEAIENGNVEDCLNYIDVKAGDIINIPAGLVHAIGKGILLAEVQQNSDTTYRVYDYGRLGVDGKPRELHVDKSLEVIDFSMTGSKVKKAEGLEVKLSDKSSSKVAIVNKYFSIEILNIKDEVSQEADGSRFYAYVFCEGKGKINYEGGELQVKMGETVLIPADMGKYTLSGDFVAIKTCVPNVNEVIASLKNAGFSQEDIEDNIVGLSQ